MVVIVVIVVVMVVVAVVVMVVVVVVVVVAVVVAVAAAVWDLIRILDVCQGGTESKSSTRYATRVGAVCKCARTRGSHSAATTAATANAGTPYVNHFS